MQLKKKKKEKKDRKKLDEKEPGDEVIRKKEKRN